MRREDRTARGTGRKTGKDTGKGNQMTALRFQTAGRHQRKSHQESTKKKQSY